MMKDDIFRIASQTKAITSVAAMILYEEGRFLLDDPVSKYIPSFANEKVLDKFNPEDSSYTTVPAKRQVTIRCADREQGIQCYLRKEPPDGRILCGK
jgi:CubicO group peptidase (beta-lactamase class C family)